MTDKQTMETLLRKLEDRIDKDATFSESEISALHEMVSAWRGWQSLGRATKWVIISLGLLAGAVAAFGNLEKSVKGVLKSWLG